MFTLHRHEAGKTTDKHTFLEILLLTVQVTALTFWHWNLALKF
jgi:hypothetical protein